jgi:hypothetical protein
MVSQAADAGYQAKQQSAQVTGTYFVILAAKVM